MWKTYHKSVSVRGSIRDYPGLSLRPYPGLLISRPIRPLTRRVLLIFALAGLLPVILTACESRSEDTQTTQTMQTVQTITISAVGDCTLGRNYKIDYENSWDALFARYGADYFLQNVSDVFQEDDITIANLEGVLSESAQRQETFYRQKQDRIAEKKYCHLGKPEYLQALTLGGIDAVSFANNHNIDYGLQGFEDTLDACDTYNLPVAYYDNVVRMTVHDIPVGIVSIDSTYCSLDIAEAYLRAAIADLRTDCKLIIACMHWGKNYEELPNEEQQYLGHLCVDLGADMVIGNHAHILQGVERYKGRYIFYALGNFTYGGRAVPRDTDTMIAQQTFTFMDGELAIDDNVTIIPCWMSGRIEINDFCPVIKDGAAASTIIEKVNALSEDLGTTFDESGHPSMAPAVETGREACEAERYEQDPSRVPEIIHTLVGE